MAETSKNGLLMQHILNAGQEVASLQPHQHHHLQKRVSDFGIGGAAPKPHLHHHPLAPPNQLLTRSNSLTLRQLSDSLNNLFQIQQGQQQLSRHLHPHSQQPQQLPCSPLTRSASTAAGPGAAGLTPAANFLPAAVAAESGDGHSAATDCYHTVHGGFQSNHITASRKTAEPFAKITQQRIAAANNWELAVRQC